MNPCLVHPETAAKSTVVPLIVKGVRTTFALDIQPRSHTLLISNTLRIRAHAQVECHPRGWRHLALAFRTAAVTHLCDWQGDQCGRLDSGNGMRLPSARDGRSYVRHSCAPLFFLCPPALHNNP